MGYNLWGCKESDMTEQQVWHGIYTASGITINLEMIYSIRGYIYVYCIILYRDLGLLRFSYPQEGQGGPYDSFWSQSPADTGV